jgi:hypothetical protein
MVHSWGPLPHFGRCGCMCSHDERPRGAPVTYTSIQDHRFGLKIIPDALNDFDIGTTLLVHVALVLRRSRI